MEHIYRMGWCLLLFLCCIGCTGGKEVVLAVSVDWGRMEVVEPLSVSGKEQVTNRRDGFCGAYILGVSLFPFGRAEVSTRFSAGTGHIGLVIQEGRRR